MSKHPGGRPLKYKTVEELQNAIDEYFLLCDNRVQQVYSAKSDGVIEVLDPEPYTISGLALAMGIDRDTLLNYEKRDEYFGTIKSAKDKVHADVERRLMEKQATGAIFNLKNNFGWRDKTETDITSGGEKIQPLLGGASVQSNDSNSETTETE